MKNVFSILTLIVCLFLIVSCSNKSTAPNNSEDLNQTSIGDDIPSDVATEVFDKAPITTKNVPQLEDEKEDCHGERQVKQNLDDVNGSILKVGDLYVISANGGNSRYNPCKLPGKLKQDGLNVRFSGEVLEIFPNERLVATPFRLKYIVERDN